MARDDDFDWIDDAFDDKRTANDMRKSGMSTGVGCLIGAIALVLVAGFVMLASLSALGLVGQLAQ